jgi:hypothetical protein
VSQNSLNAVPDEIPRGLTAKPAADLAEWNAMTLRRNAERIVWVRRFMRCCGSTPSAEFGWGPPSS